ncbi:MAG: hypothetical protein JWO97_4584, partial [Acidobacteria bacterium]|nr:hypothetical protein [Acidobacteriota bacterium]
MRNFRHFLRGPAGRVITAVLVLATVNVFIDSHNYLAAYEVARQREANIREIAAKMNVDPEFLLHPEGRRKFDFKSLFAAVEAKLGLQSAAVTTASSQPANIRESIDTVKRRYALVAADSTLAQIAQLMQLATAPVAIRGNKRAAIKGQMLSILRLIDKDFL